jgi:hypothetical protein
MFAAVSIQAIDEQAKGILSIKSGAVGRQRGTPI